MAQPSLRIYPHRVASGDGVGWAWWLEKSGTREPCSQLVAEWDYAAELTVGLTAVIDPERLLEETGIRGLQDLAVVAVVDCRSTQRRFVESRSLANYSPDREFEIAVTIPRGSAAEQLTLIPNVVLDVSLDRTAPRLAHLKGSRLLEGPATQLLLEGDAGRFPVEPASFSEQGLGPAPWTVLLAHESMDDSFMGSVRLLINTDHPVGKVLLSPETAPRFNGVLQAELLRLLVAGLSRDELDGVNQPEEGSVADVMESMCQTLIGYTFDEAASLYLNDPIRFDRLLHDRLNPLKGFVA